MVWSSKRIIRGRSADIVALLIALLLNIGCSRSKSSPRFEDSGPSITDAGENDSSIDGENDEPPVVSEMTCVQDTDCPASEPCQRYHCGSTGQCLSTIYPDGSVCFEHEARSICIAGVCQVSICGDGFVDRVNQEHCDDGNFDTTDSCINCQEATCGDGFVQLGVEACDSPADRFCKSDCTPIVCGDGVIDETVENCEPDMGTEPCDAMTCRISDTPEWLIELNPLSLVPPFGNDASNPLLLLDGKGNPIVIYAKSESGGSVRAYKYNTDGHMVWSYHSDESVIPLSATVDISDNVIIAGSYTDGHPPWLVKLDRDGIEQWSASISESSEQFVGVASDEQGNIAVVSSAEPSDTSPWLNLEPKLELFDSDGTYRPDEQITVDGSYITSKALSSGVIGGVFRYLMAGAKQNDSVLEPNLVLLDDDLSDVWDDPVTYSSPLPEVGFLRAFPTSDGDIIALGASTAEFENRRYWFERFSPQGVDRWTQTAPLRADTRFLGSSLPSPMGNIINFPMAVDSEDNIFVAVIEVEVIDGRATPISNGGRSNILIDKYGPDGSLKWERPLIFDSAVGPFGILPAASDRPVDLAVDKQGAIFMLSCPVVGGGMMHAPPQIVSIMLHKWRQPDQL